MIGAKARSLQRLQNAGFRVPPFFSVTPSETLDAAVLATSCAAISTGELNPLFAVRSSAEVEDGADRSFAGMFETFLFVPRTALLEKIELVRRSGTSERILAYDTQQSTSTLIPSVIVQRMVDAECAGVAFGRDPVDGSDNVVVAAAPGVGTHVVDGESTADTYRVDRSDTIETRSLTGDRAPALNDARVIEVARLVRAIGTCFGAPQDVEWAIGDGVVYVLQARPVTTPPGIIWDNSNISESYGGVVLPLTFSFASHAYAGAYRQFMRVLAIPEATIDANDDLLHHMLGHIAGRMYYNLLNWYRLLALVPGFKLNRSFMESMMGVGEALPAAVVHDIEAKQKVRQISSVVRMLFAMTRHHRRLKSDIARFHQHVDETLTGSPPPASLSLEQLAAEFARLETQLLENWQAPLVNDFFAMIYYGILRRLCERWCDDRNGSIHNDLLCGEGGMISAEPARRVRELAELARSNVQLAAVLSTGTRDAIEDEIPRHPHFGAAYDDYLRIFGDRCQNELKLESITLRDDPLPLLRAIGRIACAPAIGSSAANDAAVTRANAEPRIKAALRGRPLRTRLFRLVLANARARIRDRENLRFERTRVFARVREIFTAVGERLQADGYLERASDVYYLELADVRRAATDPASRVQLSTLVRERKAEFERYAALRTPPDRFTAIGSHPPESLPATSATTNDDERRGIGCCPGVVRAKVRIARDSNAPLEPGEILVAERTDPGWVVLFPAAAGILVERGSVLSHAAIVSREMGIPSVVAVPDLTRWLCDGDLVVFDGRAGVVRRLQRAVP